MQRIPRFMFLSFAISSLASLAFMGGSASAQTVFGPGQTCSNSAYGGPYVPGGQISCQITAPNGLTQGMALAVTDSSFVGTTALQCEGINGPGYSIQAESNPVSTGYYGAGYAGEGSCVFQVTLGSISPGQPIGTVMLTPPYSGYNSNIQLTVSTCSDPTCGGLLASPYTSYSPYTPYSAYTPPPPPPPPLYNTTPTITVVTSDSNSNSYQGEHHHHHHHHDGDGDDGGH